jgi:hypothetical protein
MVAPSKSKRALTSIIISAMSAGFTGSALSFDYDVDPSKRKETPGFYGYVPDGGSRTVVFVCMFVNSMLLLLLRGFSSALLISASPSYFFMYITIDMLVFLLYKIMRNDFYYWLPFTGITDTLVSLVMRIIVKTISDYTGIVHLRGSIEMGGIYWLFNSFIGLCVPFVSVKIYFHSVPVDRVVDPATAKTIVGLLSGSWIAVFALFFVLINAEYRKTFYSLESGRTWAKSFFLHGKTDSVRTKPLRLNKKLWLSIRPQMKEYVLDNYELWENTRPDFFTDSFVRRIDADMIPLGFFKMDGEYGNEGRRSSLSEMLGVRGSRKSRKSRRNKKGENEEKGGKGGSVAPYSDVNGNSCSSSSGNSGNSDNDDKSKSFSSVTVSNSGASNRSGGNDDGNDDGDGGNDFDDYDDDDGKRRSARVVKKEKRDTSKVVPV